MDELWNAFYNYLGVKWLGYKNILLYGSFY